MMSLSLKTLIITFLQIASVFILARFLNPQDYGIFGILNGWIGVALFFTDIGIGGALIRQKEDPTYSQLQTYIGTQLALACSIAFLFWVFATPLCDYYHLKSEEVKMIRVLSLILPISVLSSIPKMFLQRRLKFGSLAKLEIAEALIVYLTQINLAILGWGVWSLIVGGLLRATVSTCVVYWFYKEIHLPKITWVDLQKFLPFGIPFQFNSMLPVLRGIVMPAILSHFFGVDAIGLIFWAMGLTSMPLEFASNYNTVAFSSLSRLQNDREGMRHFATRGIEIMLILFGFIFGLGATCGAAIITLFFNAKWTEAKPLIPLAAIAVSLIATRHLSTSILNANGKPLVRLWIEGFAVLIEIPLLFFFLSRFAMAGFFYSAIITSSITLLITIVNVKSFLENRVVLRFIAVTTASCLSFFIVYFFHCQNNLIYSFGLFVFIFTSVAFVLDSSSKRDVLILLKLLANKFGFKPTSVHY